jgi:hypothetical protein
MARVIPAIEEAKGHPIRELLGDVIPPVAPDRSRRQEDVAFFLISFACAFIILYGFIF